MISNVMNMNSINEWNILLAIIAIQKETKNEIELSFARTEYMTNNQQKDFSFV